jgi:hypothetical protein
MAPGASYEVISVLADGEQFAAEWVMRPGRSARRIDRGPCATAKW